jgi:hypothetical protein
MRTSLSRRALLGGTAGLTALGRLSPILLSFDAAAAETINLTLPWIPEGEVAFMYAARKQSFWLPLRDKPARNAQPAKRWRAAPLVHHAARRRGVRVATRSGRAAAGDASDSQI